MTSLPQKPGLQPPQGQSNATQAASSSPTSASASQKSPVPVPSSSSPSSATSTSTPAASSSSSRTYANAANATVDGSAHNLPHQHHNHHGKLSSASPVNGKPMQHQQQQQQQQQAQSSGVTIVNGAPHSSTTPPNTTAAAAPTTTTTAHGDHSRKPSVTITSAGASGYMPNGAGPSSASRPNSLQFGSLNQQSSSSSSSPGMGGPAVPAATNHPHHHYHQPSQHSGLAVAASPVNPRVTSPQTSPSPIPQPTSSGGRPPSTYQSQGNGPTFGSFAEMGETNRQMRPQGHLGPGPQTATHLRRESSQSTHSDLSNHHIGNGPGRGGYPHHGGGGRGRAYSQSGYQGQMPYSPGPNFRSAPNQPRGGPNMGPQFHHGHNQGRPLHHFPNSPHQANRSPALANAHPVTPQMNQVPMAQMPPQHYAYGQHMGPQPGYTHAYDPNYAYYNPAYAMQHMQYMTPPSPQPRPGIPYNAQTPYMQSQFPVQPPPPPPQATPLSRTSSQVSNDRPASSVGQGQPPSMPVAPGHAHSASRSSNSSAPKAQFVIPPKKSAITIRDPGSGAVKTFEKNPSSPAHGTSSPVKMASPTPTPSPPSNAEQSANHGRSESSSTNKNEKSVEEKKRALRDAVLQKIEQDEVEQARQKKGQEDEASRKKEEAEAVEEASAAADAAAARKKVEDEEEKAVSRKRKEEEQQKQEKEQEAAAARMKEEEKEREEKEKEAAARKTKEEEEAKAATAADAKAKSAAEEQKKAAESAPAPAPAADKEEIDFDAIEREMAEAEAKEAAMEAEYQRKKQAEKENKQRKEKEEEEAYIANMKNAEREAEAQEAAKEQKKQETADNESSKLEAFSSLRKGGWPATEASTPTSTGTDELTATPVSDVSMGPPGKPASATGAAKRDKPAGLKLETAKAVEPPQPSAAMKALHSARFVDDLSKVNYPPSIVSPNPKLNESAPADRKFHYNKEFLLQFQSVFKEKPSADWEVRVRETVGEGDTSRPQSARTPGMGSRGGSRPGVQPVFNMGMFSQSPRHGMGPATPSEQRFAMSNAARTVSMGPNPFNFGPGRGMGMGSPAMSRTNSANAMGAMGGGPGRVPSGSRTGTGTGSRRGPKKKEEETNKNMPLTAGKDLKPLTTSTSGWKPQSVSQNAAAAGPTPGADRLPPDMVQRKVKAALNKMTPEKFDRIASQILDIVSQSKDESDGRTLRQVIQLTFEKATDEAHWAPMYAKFCKCMLQSMSPEIKDEGIHDRNGQVVAGGNLFRKYLLNRCQEEFERGWKVNLPPKPEGDTEEAAMMSDEYYAAAAAKRRGLGLVKFIGELYKLGMLTERIMHECVKKLVDYEGVPDEAEVESLTSLLRTIGASLDVSEKGHTMMDAYFVRISMMEQTPNLPSRTRFMLMDIIDLRKANWASKDADKGPKTIHEIREAAARAQQEAEMERMRQQVNRGGGGRPGMGRGDARNFSGFGQQAPPPDFASSKVGSDDLRRLRTTRTSNQPMSFGPSSMLGSRSNSGRRNLGPGGNLVRGSDDSGSSSRTGTPTGKKEDKEGTSSINAYSALADLSGDMGTSPPSNPTSPNLTKAVPAIERRLSKTPSKDGEQGQQQSQSQQQPPSQQHQQR